VQAQERSQQGDQNRDDKAPGSHDRKISTKKQGETEFRPSLTFTFSQG